MFFKKSVIFFLCLFAAVLSAQTTTLMVNAGPNKKICLGNQDTLNGSASGGTKPYQSVIWSPGKSLSDSTILNPIASPTTTTVYTLTVKDALDAKATSTVTVYVYTYTVYAGKDTTIREGQTITLHGFAPGDSLVYWSPVTGNILNPNTLTPDVYPQDTTIYTLMAVFPNGCKLYDQIRVNIVPDGYLYFFNSFSPNNDNVNDYFVIGNIDQYPNNTLEVYNRYGQKVFSRTDYKNDWNGSYLGNELPCGTYFYIVDTQDPKGGKYHGEINIIK